MSDYAWDWMKQRPITLKEAVEILERHDVRHEGMDAEFALKLAREFRRSDLFIQKAIEALGHAVHRDHGPAGSCDMCALVSAIGSPKAKKWLESASFDWDAN